MITWMHVIDVGHTAVMVPVAGAIAAWLILGRAWKLAACWCLVFAAGLGIVAASKIAYLGWGLELPAIGFKALSGHAWRAMAVLPVLFFLMLQHAYPRWRMHGLLFGVALGLALDGLLVVFRFHTVSEVVASSVLGIGAVLVFLHAASRLPGPVVQSWAVPVALMSFLLIHSLKPSSINPKLVDVALFFSGRDAPFSWYGEGGALPRKPPREC